MPVAAAVALRGTEDIMNRRDTVAARIMEERGFHMLLARPHIREVLYALRDGPATPGDLRVRLEISRTNASFALRRLFDFRFANREWRRGHRPEYFIAERWTAAVEQVYDRDPEVTEEERRFHATLAKTNVLEILLALRKGEKRNGKLEAEVGLSQSRLSQVVRRLIPPQMDLLLSRRDGSYSHTLSIDKAGAWHGPLRQIFERIDG